MLMTMMTTLTTILKRRKRKKRVKRFWVCMSTGGFCDPLITELHSE